MTTNSEDWIRAGKFKVQIKRSYDAKPGRIGLSSREIQFLTLLTQGHNLKSIAREMQVSPHTADTYKRRVYDKLGVKSAACAVAIAVAFFTGAAIEFIDPNDLPNVC